MKKQILMVFLLLTLGVYADTITHGGTTLNMDFVEIGHVGNTPDTTGHGAVGYNYRIGKYEVTHTQFAAVRAADNRIGSGDEGRWDGVGADAPAAKVSALEAMKFCNWLTTGDAHAGVYQFNVYGTLLIAIDRAAAVETYDMVYVLPTEDEWYKAAYFKPDASGYSLYANGSDDAASVILGTPNGWNYGFPLDFPFSTWPTGYGAEEQNGTHDMMGNIEEWTESGWSDHYYLRGGKILYDVEDLSSSYFDVRDADDDSSNYGDVGFRVAVVGSMMSFNGLGSFLDVPPFSQGEGISGDGSTVVGRSYSFSADAGEAFRWTKSGGMVGLGDLPEGLFASWAHDVSDNGSAVVGVGVNTNNNEEAFRWMLSDGMVGLGDLPGGTFYSWAYGVSADGSVVVGKSKSANGNEAFLWTQSGGMIGLGDLPGGTFYSWAYGVSADGSIVVGVSRSANGFQEAFLWTQSGGMVGLGDLPGDSFISGAQGVSADGSTVVGFSDSTNGTEAFRWTQSGGMVGLGGLDGSSFYSWANDVSADGSVVVGKSRSINGTEAFVWDELNGMRSLKTLLEGDGIDLIGWTLTEAKAISDDGTVIVGYGINPDGNNEAFLATIVFPLGEIGVSGNSGSLVDAGSESFGNQAVGIGKKLTFTINNEATGDAANLTGLSITKSGLDASAFVVGALGATSLAPENSTTFRVTFTPASATVHSAAIHILSNDADESPFDINLTGTGLANSDTDPGSDAWETANGFSPTVDGDVMTLDSDGDGSPDVWEMYQGTEPYPVAISPLADGFEAMAGAESEDGNGFSNVCVSNGILKVRYRRSTTQTVVAAQGTWLPDLMDNTWLYSGENSSGTVVTVSETVVSNGPSFEIIEASSEITSGDSDTLFFTLELTPNE